MAGSLDRVLYVSGGTFKRCHSEQKIKVNQLPRLFFFTWVWKRRIVILEFMIHAKSELTEIYDVCQRWEIYYVCWVFMAITHRCPSKNFTCTLLIPSREALIAWMKCSFDWKLSLRFNYKHGFHSRILSEHRLRRISWCFYIMFAQNIIIRNTLLIAEGEIACLTAAPIQKSWKNAEKKNYI